MTMTMTPTSDERREVAERLRQMADAHDATEASRVARALELEYKVYGTVVAFDSADIRNLADLIDPTCHLVSTTFHSWSDGSAAFYHELNCGHTCETVWAKPPSYCTECGARVVDK